MTGVEAVSNAIPLFRKPTVPNAQWTLTIIIAILGAFLLAIGYLCPAYHVRAMDEQQPGYQTIFSQLVGAMAGDGVFYYIAIASIFAVLIFSACVPAVGRGCISAVILCGTRTTAGFFQRDHCPGDSVRHPFDRLPRRHRQADSAVRHRRV